MNCKKNNNSYSVHIDNKLHGKIYISLKAGTPIQGIITSANFTNSRLESNYEWGVLIEDISQLSKLINEIESVASRALSTDELEKVIKKIDTFSQGTVFPKEPKVDLTVSDIIDKAEEEYAKVKRLLSFIIALVGFIVLGLTVKKAFADYVTLNSIDLLVTFSIPIVLSLLFIPIAYSYAVYSKYQELFIIMSFKEPENKEIRTMHRCEIMKACKFSYRKVTYFRKTHLKEMYVNMSQDEFYKIIEKFKQISSND